MRPGVCPLPVAERQPAPDVTLPVLQTDVAPAAGVTELSLADLEGRVVIVNFWESVVRRVPQRTADVIEDVAVKLFT